jgi:hypothetical protein
MNQNLEKLTLRIQELVPDTKDREISLADVLRAIGKTLDIQNKRGELDDLRMKLLWSWNLSQPLSNQKQETIDWLWGVVGEVEK